VSEALALAAGVVVEATMPRELWSIGEELPVRPTLYNRGKLPVTVTEVSVRIENSLAKANQDGITVAPDSSVTLDRFDRTESWLRFKEVSAPYWLSRPRMGAMSGFPVFGFDEAAYANTAHVVLQLSVDGVEFAAHAPVVRRFADQVLGELQRPIAAVPAVSVRLEQEVEYAPARVPIERELRVHLWQATDTARDVSVTLRLPAGLTTDSTARTVTLPPAGSARTVPFRVRGQLAAGSHVIVAVASHEGREYSSGYATIDYEHIAPRRLYRPSRLTIEAVDVSATTGMRVGYLQGVGDNSAPALEQLGIAVTRLNAATLGQADLSGYSAIVVGPRAYETQPALVANNARLLDYARQGGTLVVQYGQYEMQQPGIMPYPITINRPHDRVTVEGVPVTIIDSTAAILRSPNRITARDFDGWIQDRSLYMPRTFDPAYVPVLEMNDPGEAPNRGALLVAPLGRGTYVYTTLAFFRQLPNGVPGAARLFVNLLAAKAGRTNQ
jgi:hypothetical protein